MIALSCSVVDGKAVYAQKFNWGSCNIYQISPVTNNPVCFTTEAIKYGQTAYFDAVVVCQLFNALLCKTCKLSIVYQGLNNAFMLFGLTTEILLALACAYFYPFNIAFGTRDVIFMHFGITSLPFAMLQLILDEVKKLIIRTVPRNEKGKPSWWERMVAW
jgi:sodium/potassium-transporting ATPase subunit alpha